MSRLTGGKITEGDARRVLQPFGPVECVWWSSKTEREMYQLPEGIWVKFAYFQDCRDAQGVSKVIEPICSILMILSIGFP